MNVEEEGLFICQLCRLYERGREEERYAFCRQYLLREQLIQEGGDSGEQGRKIYS